MLSYRHGYHAGNHGDVLKHWACVLIANYLGQKSKPYWYIDTHSAAGVYALSSEQSQKTQEYQAGIKTLWEADAPQVFDDYLEIIRGLNPDGKLSKYPGSPWFVRQCLRESDKARLFELHPQDFELLLKNFRGDRQVKMAKEDGFNGLKSILPPPPKRGLVVIDPPYEQAKEYDLVVKNMEQAIKRFATGVYVIWYPLINRKTKQSLSETMVEKLKGQNVNSYLDVRLWVNGRDEDEGMYGSGLMILNPPWNLKDQLNEGLPFLVEKLGQTANAGFSLDFHEH